VVYATGLVVFSIAYVGLGLTTTASWVWLLLPLYGCYTALTDGVSRAWVADTVPDDVVGSALGIYAAIAGVGALTAGIVAGLAWGGTGRLPLLVSGVVVAVVAVGLLVGGRVLDPDTRVREVAP
jgi:MFS family permease